MNFITTLIAVLALIGSAIVGGVFFAFSSFIMKALARALVSLAARRCVVLPDRYISGNRTRKRAA